LEETAAQGRGGGGQATLPQAGGGLIG
jgi:hypothetical protein